MKKTLAVIGVLISCVALFFILVYFNYDLGTPLAVQKIKSVELEDGDELNTRYDYYYDRASGVDFKTKLSEDGTELRTTFVKDFRKEEYVVKIKRNPPRIRFKDKVLDVDNFDINDYVEVDEGVEILDYQLGVATKKLSVNIHFRNGEGDQWRTYSHRYEVENFEPKFPILFIGNGYRFKITSPTSAYLSNVPKLMDRRAVYEHGTDASASLNIYPDRGEEDLGYVSAFDAEILLGNTPGAYGYLFDIKYDEEKGKYIFTESTPPLFKGVNVNSIEITDEADENKKGERLKIHIDFNEDFDKVNNYEDEYDGWLSLYSEKDILKRRVNPFVSYRPR